jgi:RND family efflux transporter, MFP subunit
MDLLIEETRNRWGNKKYYYVIIGLAVLLILYFLLPGRVSSYVVDEDTILYDVVKHGDFDVLVRGPGLIRPKTTRWLSSEVQGRVDLLQVKPGDSVEKDDILVVLKNPTLLEDLEAVRSEYDALKSETKANIANLKTELEEQKFRIKEADIDYELAAAVYSAENSLYERGNSTISEIALKRSDALQRRLSVNLQIQKQRLNTLTENYSAQLEALNARLDVSKRRFEHVQSRVDKLNVRAVQDGVVQDLFVEVGQELEMGEEIATLAMLDELIAEVRIPQTQIQQIAIGQSATVDTRTSKIRGEVSRIYPAVINGTVQVNLNLIGPLPRETRADLSIDAVINISNMQDSLYIRRPVHASADTTVEMYKLTDNNNYAEKIRVELGVASTDSIQVLSGLDVGDKVVVSETTSWGSHKIVKIN